MKRGLLILSGQWRTFESVYPQMKEQYSHFDIVVSTWDTDYGIYQEISKPVTEERIKALFPNAKGIYIHNESLYNEEVEPQIKSDFLTSHFAEFNTHKMVHHWKYGLPHINDSYDVVVLQRFDLLCNTSKILEEDIEEGKLYIDWSWFGEDEETPFAQDFLFISTPSAMKKWIESFPEKFTMMDELLDTKYEQGPLAHISIGFYMKKFGMGDILQLTDTLKKVWYKLIKRVPNNNKLPYDLLGTFNQHNIVFFDLDIKSTLFKKVLNQIENYRSPWRQDGNRSYTDIFY